jgi:hypothetical protein
LVFNAAILQLLEKFEQLMLFHPESMGIYFFLPMALLILFFIAFVALVAIAPHQFMQILLARMVRHGAICHLYATGGPLLVIPHSFQLSKLDVPQQNQNKHY